ncbi:2-phosphosulfolactate phosphatase [Nocardioides bizhenqiangii]|uniref:Probable 2-phosphosulfolactate phosphatase n=1 Tax=Nocardioides bizhenqiangii TaxID=3095076 RepID=A0ABZ0ZQ57_9ACTN|nr:MULTISPECIES: 2-phosphosulfolactate phosphatase [unclassified Nocardioides]MDZ5619528.1 2-phosphosulfolactate phosphatase [Nocardioides sp. HM23]WQQ26455.1 2-phosphosulfolactate phosphatase [Nocardioides sp. HM61]
MTPAQEAAHGQESYDVRLDWGPTGGAAVSRGADVAVVVDVLSFTTTLGIAVAQGTRVYPFPWKDERAAAFAAEQDAVLAVGRFEAAGLADPPPSLSPAQLLTSAPVDRLVLPSPNGSTICAALADAVPTVVGASLRNRSAVARWLAPRLADGAVVAFVPAGERWPDGSLRPGLEDLWGAGAVLAALDLAGLRVSPEAGHAAASYGTVAGDLAAALDACASGRELAEVGYAADVVAAAAVDADAVVPVFTGDGFVAG